MLRTGIIMLSSLLSACTEVGLRAINVPSYLLSDMVVETDLRYGDKAHQKLDLYRPGSGVEDRRELIIFVYGGDWTSGTKEGYYFVADALSAAGYRVAIVDYVKYPQATFPAFVADIALAVNWLAGTGARFEHIERIILMGHSAGAHMAALLISDPRYLGAHHFPIQRIDAFIGLAGPYAYLPENQRYRDIFGNLDDFSEMQPLHFLSGNEPPMLLLHGADDSTVLPLHTRKFHHKARSTGVAATQHIYPGRGHAGLVLALSRMYRRNNEVRGTILDFLQQQP
jgi:acetyl esterase/lipase